MNDYPQMITPVDHVAPVPRRVRATLSGETVLDTTKAVYVWEWPNYPQYYIPISDVNTAVLIDEHHKGRTSRGSTELFGLRAGETHRRSAARLFTESMIEGIKDSVRFEWNSLDSWFEEDEEVFVHPRNPYVRVDALRSTRTVQIQLEGAVLAESASPIMVFETGLPTRYYLNRTEVSFEYLEATKTVTSCPYKGKTSAYWSVRLKGQTYTDLAWSYDFPTRQLLPIAGLIAFYNEKVDIHLDGEPLPRPITHFS